MTYQEAVKELKAGKKIRNYSIHIEGSYIFLDEDCEISYYNPEKDIIESYSNEWLTIKGVSPNSWEIYNKDKMTANFDIKYSLYRDHDHTSKIDFLKGLGFTTLTEAEEGKDEVTLYGLDLEVTMELFDEICYLFGYIEYDGRTFWIGGNG